MRRAMVFSAAIVFSVAVFANEKVCLWPGGKMPDAQKHQIAAMTDVSRKAGFNADEWREPYIEWMEKPNAAKNTDICMILISGGSYQNCCDVKLVKTWAKKFTAMGVQCVNLVYRTPRPKGLPIYQSAWEDGQRAVRLVRADAEKRGFDPEKIGVISMSAGSHLAVLLATSSLTPAYEPVDDLDRTIPCHINWALPNAIAYALTDGYGVPNTTGGDDPDVKLGDYFKFDEKTCPMSMTHGGKDQYSPISSTFVYRKLRSMGIPAEVHLYADRPHCADGFDRQVEFMRQMGYFGKLPESVKLLDRFAKIDGRDMSKYRRENIWPEGKTPDFQQHQCVPYLEWNIPSNLTTKAIQIIYSGGGYKGNSVGSFEVAPFRKYLNAKGVAVVTMKYRTPRPKGIAKHITAWQDLQRAIRIVRSEAPKFGLDPDRIGIMGSSAGGHLTLMGATSSTKAAYEPIDEIDSIPCNVQWAVAIYPAYSLTDGIDSGNASGGNDDSAVPVPEFAFDEKVCPTLFIHGDADKWAAMNSVKIWEKMRRMGVQGTVHTLAKRPHCFQKEASPGTGSYSWMDRIWDFLTAKGFVK